MSLKCVDIFTLIQNPMFQNSKQQGISGMVSVQTVFFCQVREEPEILYDIHVDVLGSVGLKNLFSCSSFLV